MRRYLLLILAAAAVGVIQASFVGALPSPASAVGLPLILIVALVTNFRPIEAFIAAAAAGLAMDVLSSLPFGTNAALMVAAAAVTVGLFARIFTHHTWLGTVGINLCVYALLHAAMAVVRAIRAVFIGFDALPPLEAAMAGAAAAAIIAQLAMVLAAVAAGAAARRWFSRFFFLRR